MKYSTYFMRFVINYLTVGLICLILASNLSIISWIQNKDDALVNVACSSWVIIVKLQCPHKAKTVGKCCVLIYIISFMILHMPLVYVFMSVLVWALHTWCTVMDFNDMLSILKCLLATERVNILVAKKPLLHSILNMANFLMW